jgi:hypothetical protein
MRTPIDGGGRAVPRVPGRTPKKTDRYIKAPKKARKKEPSERVRLFNLEDDATRTAYMLCFTGSPFGGESLEVSLARMREEGPQWAGHAARHMLRCIEALLTLEATRLARCQLTFKRPMPSRLKQFLDSLKRGSAR